MQHPHRRSSRAASPARARALQTSPARHAPVGPRRWILPAALIAVVAAVGVALLPGLVPAEPAVIPPSPTMTSLPTPLALTPQEQLLATTADPDACAVAFDAEGVELNPQLQTQQTLFASLPIPSREGMVFAGWYPTADAATAQDPAARVNGSRIVDCVDRRLILHGAWSPAGDAPPVRVPILMYHQFTTKPEGEQGWLRGNYAYIGDFTAQMEYIAAGGFYLPTWDELDAFIDGRLRLPARSVIITDDDADPTWLDLAVPVVTGNHLLSTSFVITKYRHDPSPSPYVLQRSHTDEMHEAGANGKGRLVNWTPDEIAADLERSAGILGAKEVVAYPYGHINETGKQGVRQAGFTLGRTIEWGYVTPGIDKLALPVIRINYGDTVETLKKSIG